MRVGKISIDKLECSMERMHGGDPGNMAFENTSAMKLFIYILRFQAVQFTRKANLISKRSNFKCRSRRLDEP